MDHSHQRRRRGSGAVLTAAAFCVFGAAPLCRATITLQEISTTDWKISNGPLNVVFDPAGGKITSLSTGTSGNLLDPSNSQLYPEFAGTPFGSGSQTFAVTQTANYIDFSTTTASTGTSTNPITYAFHYILFNNDPAVHMYEVLDHSATDPATSVGQGQFLMRVNPSDFFTQYQVALGPNNPGPQVTTLPTGTQLTELNSAYADANRLDIPEVLDLNGLPDLESTIGRDFLNKYDYSSYEQFHQAQVEYGPNYAVADVVTSQDTMTGGPTKQNLQFTNNILMAEFLSNHYGDNASPFTYSYTPPQGVASQRLFGPYTFRITPVGTETGAQLYQDAVSSAATYPALFDTDSVLAANGYVPTTDRGSLAAVISNTAGWSSNVDNNTIVLSAPFTNFQNNTTGYQYWSQLSANGTGEITGIVPGTYRMSIYQLGQWGETRVDNVVVSANKVSVPQNVKFTPENFGTAAPIFTIGTPNRSANEFLNGHNADGSDNRNYWGSYNYWQEEANLGNNGRVVYYATAVGSTPATNNPNNWIANQWQVFNPTLYNPADNTGDLYPMEVPAYVGNPATYTGLPWEVHFTTTAAQQAQGRYVVLSVALAASESDLTVSLNGNAETWTIPSTRVSDPNNRSGQSGLYQWAAFQFPTSDLDAVGAGNEFTFTVDKSGGVMYDAIRMEITNTSASPAVTGWQDYDYMSQGNPQVAFNDVAGLTGQNQNAAQYSAWNVSGGGTWGTGGNWTNSSIPQQATSVANFLDAITTPSTVNLNTNWNVGTVNFNNANSYTLAPGSGGTLTMDNGSATSLINDSGGTHFITAPVTLNSNLLVTVANSGDALTISGPISGNGGITINGLGGVTLAAANTYAGATLVKSGSLQLAAPGALPAGNALTIGTAASSAAVQLAAGTGRQTLSTLVITNGSELDVTNNALAINYGSPAADPAAQIALYLAAGYNGGAWTGLGITSTAAAASPNRFAIGYADGNADRGTPAQANQVLIVYTLAGDADLDGTVGFTDLVVVAQNFGFTGQDWSRGNFTYDPAGSVGFADLVLVAQNFGFAAPLATGDGPSLQVSPAWLSGTTSVPEPAAAALAIVLSGLLARRR